MFDCFKKKKVKTKEVLPSKKNFNWYNVALENVEEREIRGTKNNPLIEKMFEAVIGKKLPDETPWCAAFVGYCLKEAGYKTSGKLNARSYVSYGEEVKEEDLKKGDIVVFWRGNPNSWKGHVAFFVKFDGPNVVVLGGNQKDKVCFASYRRDRILAFRRPVG